MSEKDSVDISRLCKNLAMVLFLSWCSISYADQTDIENYKEARTIFWHKVYPYGHTLYCGEKFTNSKRAISKKKINVEHVFAASWMTDAIGCGTRKQCRKSSIRFNRAEADLHNMYPVLAKINSSRNNLQFGIIAGEKHKFGCDFERSDKLAEPREVSRGNIARSILYMSDEYKFEIPVNMRKLMLEWHKIDPPDSDEIRRNYLIYKLQGTVNKYIGKK